MHKLTCKFKVGDLIHLSAAGRKYYPIWSTIPDFFGIVMNISMPKDCFMEEIYYQVFWYLRYPPKNPNSSPLRVEQAHVEQAHGNWMNSELIILPMEDSENV